MKRAFTLVELLIVIALIAILSVAVLATINPIEQTNKARDAKFKNDAAEVLSAYERYYASQNNYPWNVVNGVGASVAGDVNVVASSLDGRFGVLAGGTAPGSTVYTGDGVLVTTSELKGSFKGKEPFVAGAKPEDTMYAFHDGTTNSNYVCYMPKAAANRQGTKAADLKCIDTVTNTLVDQSTGPTGCVIPNPFTFGIGSSIATVSCVPEGLIQ